MRKQQLLAIPLLLLASCANHQKSDALPESDSSEQARDISYESEATGHNDIIITKDSVGSVWIGQSVNEVHASVEGLYTSKENGASPDAVTIVFKGPEGERFIAYDFGEGKIDVINLIDTVVKVDAPRGRFGIGDSFAHVLELPGVEEEWISGYENSGTWYWKWEGLWFTPSQETISENLSRKIYNSQEAPTVSDFDDSVTIGFIGTGLPF